MMLRSSPKHVKLSDIFASDSSDTRSRVWFGGFSSQPHRRRREPLNHPNDFPSMGWGAATCELLQRAAVDFESQFERAEAPRKFHDPDRTATGEPRASVALRRLETVWFNTGTLCNITCRNCDIESSPRNDRLVYITADEVGAFLDEIERDRLGTRLI